jgi:uncharacterized protein
MTDTIPSAAERIVLRLSKEFDETPEHIAQLVIAINEGCSAPRLAWHPEETRAYSGDRRMSPERVHDIARRFEEIKLLEEHRSVAFSKLEAAGRLDETLQQAVLRASNLQTIDRLLAEQGIGGSLVPAYVQGAAEARDKGLEALAAMIRDKQLPEGKAPLDAAADFVNAERGLADATQVLEACKPLLVEFIASDDAMLERFFDQALHCKMQPGRKLPKELGELSKLEKPARQIGAREFLLIKRGVRESLLELRLAMSDEKAHQLLAEHFVADMHDPSDPLRAYWDSLLREAWMQVLRPRIEGELFERLRERSERIALDRFVGRYESLLATPGVGQRRVLGVLPSIRKPARLAVVDEQGHVLHRSTLDFGNAEKKEAATATLRELLQKHEISVVALGNGVGFRDTEGFLLEAFAGIEQRPQLLVLDEAGSVEVAKKRRSKQELAVRRATIIARRAQNPLHEWSRVEPNNTPLGEGASEVHQGHLARRLADVRSIALHRAGVDLATAHEDVLVLLDGMDGKSAHELQRLRNSKDAPSSLEGYVEKSEITAETMARVSPYLRHSGSENPLDNRRIPTSLYGLVDECATLLGLTREQLLEQPDALTRLDVQQLANDQRSIHTVRQVVKELGSTPQPAPDAGFEPVAWRSDLQSIEQLEIGMELRGRVLRLLEFGAFVDIGLPSGGLLHVSQLANHFVDDPSQVVQEGQAVTVRVLDVDKSKGRVSLTMREGDIQKIPRTLGDMASGKNRPSARVVERGERVERGPSSRFDQRSGRDDDGPRRGGRGGPRRGGRDEGGRGGRGGPGGPGGRGGERGDRGPRRGRRDDDRDVPFRRGQGGYVVESDDLQEEIKADRGAKGELKSFAALTGMLRGDDKPKEDQPKDDTPKADPPKQEEKQPEEPQREEAQANAPQENAPQEQPPSDTDQEEKKPFGEDFV